MIEITTLSATLICFGYAAAFGFGIIQTIRFQNAQKMWRCIRNELVEYGMYDEFKQKRYESFDRFKAECENSNSSGD